MTTPSALREIKLIERDLYLDGSDQPVRLNPMEARLLATLLSYVNQPVSRAVLMRQVWETDFVEDTRTLEVHVSWLRRKIEADPGRPRRLVTIRGLGYCLLVDDDS